MDDIKRIKVNIQNLLGKVDKVLRAGKVIDNANTVNNFRKAAGEALKKVDEYLDIAYIINNRKR